MRRPARKPPVFDLTIPCALCGYKIPPNELLRTGWSTIKCPKCAKRRVVDHSCPQHVICVLKSIRSYFLSSNINKSTEGK